LDEIARNLVVREETEGEVGGQGAVEFITELAAAVEEPHIVVGAQSELAAADPEGRLAAQQGVILSAGPGIARGAVGRGQQGKRAPSLFAGEAQPPLRVDNEPRVHRHGHVGQAVADPAQVKEVARFHEEGAFFRIEYRVALVDRDLQRVALDLAEVGVQRGFGHDG
jgi:hypothetical protein